MIKMIMKILNKYNIIMIFILKLNSRNGLIIKINMMMIIMKIKIIKNKNF